MEKYVSEHTLFIRDWMEEHPEETREQKNGRALWWDKKPQSLDAIKRETESAVPTKAYYYDIN